MPDLLAEEVSVEPSEEPPLLPGRGLRNETDGDARRLA